MLLSAVHWSPRIFSLWKCFITADYQPVILLCMVASHDSHMTVTWVTWQSQDSHMTVTGQSYDSHMTWYAPADWPRHCVPLHTHQRTLQCHQKWAAEQRTTQKSQTSTSIVSPIENERERCTIHLRTKSSLNGKLDSSMYNCCMQIVSLLQAGKTRGWLWDPLQRREIRGRLNLCVGTHTREWRVRVHGAQTGWSRWDYSSSLQQPLALFPDLPHLQLQANLMKLHALTQVTHPMHSWIYYTPSYSRCPSYAHLNQLYMHVTVLQKCFGLTSANRSACATRALSVIDQKH